MIVKSTEASINAEGPSVAGLSSTPISGKFKFKCIDKDGFESFSSVHNYNSATLWLNENTMKSCEEIYDKTWMEDTGESPYKEN